MPPHRRSDSHSGSHSGSDFTAAAAAAVCGDADDAGDPLAGDLVEAVARPGKGGGGRRRLAGRPSLDRVGPPGKRALRDNDSNGSGSHVDGTRRSAAGRPVAVHVVALA
jgi:hypothetical protein